MLEMFSHAYNSYMVRVQEGGVSGFKSYYGTERVLVSVPVAMPNVDSNYKLLGCIRRFRCTHKLRY